MKYIIVIALLLLPSVSLAAFDNNLSYGSRGTDVIELQEFLTSQGVYSGPISGNFFSLTRAGVAAYQAKEGITPAAGFWGPLSRSKANAAIAPSLQDDETQSITETGTTTAVAAPKRATTPRVGSVPTPTPASTPNPPTMTQPRFSSIHYQKDIKRLLITSDKQLDSSKMVLPEGITITQTLTDDTVGPKSNGSSYANKFIGDKNRGELVKLNEYSFELESTEPITTSFPIQLQDTEGNKVSMNVEIIGR